jgi:hypothetical protein
MEEWLVVVTKDLAFIIDAMVLVIVGVGTLQAFWLVAGLSFQLAADIIRTSIAPTIEELARLGIVAAIRVFLNYFLERDLSEMQNRERDSEEDKPAPE